MRLRLPESVDRFDARADAAIERVRGHRASDALFQWASDYHQPMVRAPGAEQLTLAEHARLTEAVAAHDPDAAERAVREHLTRANALYRQMDNKPRAA